MFYNLYEMFCCKKRQKYEKCVLCQEYIKDEFIIHLKCKHKYHIKCLRDWIKSNTLCPLCNKKINIVKI